MLSVDIVTISITSAVSFITALFAFWVFNNGNVGKAAKARALLLESSHKTVFLFDGNALVDATDRARQLLSLGKKSTNDWQRFTSAMRPRFPNIDVTIDAITQAGTLKIPPKNPDDGAHIEAEWWDGLTRIILVEDRADTVGAQINRSSLAAMENELSILRKTAELAPFLEWQENLNGEVIWANSAYIKLISHILPGTQSGSWPPKKLFDPSQLTLGETCQVSLIPLGQGDPLWYNVSSRANGDYLLRFGVPANEIVDAKSSLNDFVQTLTKTFAHLSIGLVVFNKSRELSLFNPALTDLTNLPFEFLSSRPTLVSFLDRLREGQMIPEPKNYKDWRQRLLEMETAASDGTFEETWTLPNGRIYRINGRPHPDGAVAFLFEDISAEISITRGFRAELELSQSVLDAIEAAVVVFSPVGIITASNTAYSKLWGVDPNTSFAEMGISDAARSWEQTCVPNNLFIELRERITTLDFCTEHTGVALHKDGRKIRCRYVPLNGGASFISFTIQQDVANPVSYQQKDSISA